MDEDLDFAADFRSFPEKKSLFFLSEEEMRSSKLKFKPGLLFVVEIGGSLSIFWSFWKIFSNVFVVILLPWSFVAELGRKF